MTGRVQGTTAGAIYRPERLKVMMQAFDAAWQDVQQQTEVSLHEVYRHKLADAVLAEADGSDDAQTLKQAALSRLALA